MPSIARHHDPIHHPRRHSLDLSFDVEFLDLTTSLPSYSPDSEVKLSHPSSVCYGYGEPGYKTPPPKHRIIDQYFTLRDLTSTGEPDSFHPNGSSSRQLSYSVPQQPTPRDPSIPEHLEDEAPVLLRRPASDSESLNIRLLQYQLPSLPPSVDRRSLAPSPISPAVQITDLIQFLEIYEEIVADDVDEYEKALPSRPSSENLIQFRLPPQQITDRLIEYQEGRDQEQIDREPSAQEPSVREASVTTPSHPVQIRMRRRRRRKRKFKSDKVIEYNADELRFDVGNDEEMNQFLVDRPTFVKCIRNPVRTFL